MTAETGAIQFSVLGTLQAVRDGTVIPLRGGRLRSLLGSLLIHANETRSVDELVNDIWGDAPPARADGALYVYVSQLRKALGAVADAVVVTRHPGYALMVDDDSIDSRVFERLAHQGEKALNRGAHADAASLLRQGLRLWRGPAFADVQTLEDACSERARLNELRLTALENTFDAELACGRHANVLPELESLVTRHPFRERVWGQLMLALYREGRQADALVAYRTARLVLLEQHGLEPGRALRRLQKAILKQDSALDLRPRRRRASRDLRWPTTLSPPKLSFVGRERELAGLTELITDEGRLVTLSGPGGVGKSRLALEAARVAAHAFPGGVFLVPLASNANPDSVLAAVLQAVGIEEANEPLRVLADALRGQRALVILDSFEHLLSAAGFVDDLLEAVPDLKAVVTSRARLRLPAERLYSVLPLSEPDAVALFTERAKTADPTLEASDQNAEAILDCCRRLDGLPLAIELAAARTRVMTPSEIAQRLERRLDLLKGGPSDAPARHRSLRAALEWSYDLLEPAEKRLLVRLGVFAGAWTLAAAESIFGSDADFIDSLTSLVDKHLVERVDGGQGESRFRMLDTVREYADELARATSELDHWQRRHAEFYVALAMRAKPELRGPDQQRWLDRLGADYDNIRAALAWALDADPELALRGASSLTRFWLVRGLTNEGQEWVVRALAATQGGDRAARAAALRSACALCFRQGDRESASAYGEESLELLRELGDLRALPFALNLVAIVAVAGGEFARARDLYDEAVDLLRSSNDTAGLAILLANSADLALNQGEVGRARSLFGEGLALAEQVGDKHAAAVTLCNLGVIALGEKDAEEALAKARRSVDVAREIGFTDGVSEALATVAGALTLLDEADRATRLLAASEAILERTGASAPPFDRAVRDRTREDLRSQLDADAFAEAWAEGERLELDQACELVSSAVDSRELIAP